MSNEYYPVSDVFCHHFYDRGCTFCAFKVQPRTVSPTKVTVKEMIAHFDQFARVYENSRDIERTGRLVVSPNGSWFVEIPRGLREHIYEYVERRRIPTLKYESRAMLFTQGKPEESFRKKYEAIHRKDAARVAKAVDKALRSLERAIIEIEPHHVVSFGLEVADDADLHLLNKGSTLQDYLNGADHVHAVGAKVCANVLLQPARVVTPIYKAFQTMEFSSTMMHAEEFLLICAAPMNGAPDMQLYKRGLWNPINATAASEVLRIGRERYPKVRISYNSMRVHQFTDQVGKFKRRKPHWSEEEKQAERRRVRDVARAFYGQDAIDGPGPADARLRRRARRTKQ